MDIIRVMKEAKEELNIIVFRYSSIHITCSCSFVILINTRLGSMYCT